MGATLDIAALRARSTAPPEGVDLAAAREDGHGCHSGKAALDKAALQAAAQAAGLGETVAALKRDYPAGPHDQPQSMCPAFGSLRVGLRMRRTATILSGSACCVYGLTFTSHFYGARRTVGYVPFNSETLVTGKLFEDIREAVHAVADPAQHDAVVVINLCVPTASGVPLRLLPREIDGVRIIGIDVPGFGVPTHAEAKDVLAGAMLKVARAEAERGPVAAPRQGRDGRPSVTLLGEMFPAGTRTSFVRHFTTSRGAPVSAPAISSSSWPSGTIAWEASRQAGSTPTTSATSRPRPAASARR
jgi:chlorophyllide a reductase subunit Y